MVQGADDPFTWLQSLFFQLFGAQESAFIHCPLDFPKDSMSIDYRLWSLQLIFVNQQENPDSIHSLLAQLQSPGKMDSLLHLLS